MRIIAGSARGLKLKPPKGLAIRPTTDRVKESVFNILAAKLPDALVADFFAGTGNLGIEALSRGAASAVFVDASQVSMSLLKENVGKARFSDKAEYLKTDVLVAIDRLVQNGRRFTLIFCDPPYNKGMVSAVLHRLDSRNLLESGGMIVIEHSKHEIIPADLTNLMLKRTERYGETLISFLAQNE